MVISMNIEVLQEIPSQEIREQIVEIWQENTEAGAALGAVIGDPTSRYCEMLAEHERSMNENKGFLVLMRDGEGSGISDECGKIVAFAWWIIGVPEGKPSHIATIKRLQVARAYQGQHLGRALLDFLHSPEVIDALPPEVEFLHLQFRAGNGLGHLYQQYGYELNVRWDIVRKNDAAEYAGWIEMIRTRSGKPLPQIRW